MPVTSPIFDRGRGYQDNGASFRAQRRATQYLEACDIAWRQGARNFPEYPAYPTGSRSGGYDVADVTFWLQSALATTFTADADGRADPATFPYEFADRFHERMVPIVTEERNAALDERLLEGGAPTRLPSISDFSRQQMDEMGRAAADGTWPDFLDDGGTDSAIRDIAWKMLTPDVRRAYATENRIGRAGEDGQIAEVIDVTDLSAQPFQADDQDEEDDADEAQ
jgi:hypothetical protein